MRKIVVIPPFRSFNLSSRTSGIKSYRSNYINWWDWTKVSTSGGKLIQSSALSVDVLVEWWSEKFEVSKGTDISGRKWSESLERETWGDVSVWEIGDEMTWLG